MQFSIMKFNKFKIEHTMKDGVQIGKVFMDGNELHGVRSVDVSIGVDEIPTVTLSFQTFDIDINTDAMEQETK